MNLVQLLTNENQTIITIIRLLVPIIQGVLFYKFFSLLLNIDIKRKEKILFVIITTISGDLTVLLYNNIIKDFISIISFFLCMFILFHQNVRNSFTALIFSYLCALVSEYASETLLMHVLKCKLDDIVHIPLYFFFCVIGGYIVYGFIILLFKLIKSKKLINILDLLSYKHTIILNLVLGIFTMVLESYLLSVHTDAIPFELTLIIIITLLIYFAISMYSIVRTNTLEKTKADLENEILYNKTLTVLHDNIRCFKHDFNNIVQAIGGYVELNDMDGLRDYYKRLLEDCKITNNLNLLNPETINNPSIYSLLTNKYYTATQKGINMTFSIFTDLSKINFNTYELSRILGILLDNAIEAAEDTDEKMVDIEFMSDSKKQLFIIKNSCKDSNISTTKIFEKGYSTKERNSGIGLWKVHKILSKNTNVDLFTTINNNIFSQQLEVFY